LSTSESPVLTSKPEEDKEKDKLHLTFSNGKEDGFLPVKNIFIAVTVPDIFPTETDPHRHSHSTKFNCRKHYEKEGFDIVEILYSPVNGLQIQAYKDNNMQELFVPERYILCLGVDYESEQPE
jgi:hypothetical protein